MRRTHFGNSALGWVPLSCLATALLLPFSLAAQQPCAAPVSRVAAREKIILTEEQEVFLGDAIAERVEGAFRVIQNEEISARLKKIGDRLTANAPGAMKYRFMLVDAAEVNAWASPGGRIYITRKLVAASRSEDELAGVMGHEVGHIASRQIAADWSRLLQKVAGVSQLGDRKTVFDAYHAFLENWARRRVSVIDEMQAEQIEADQMAVYLVARAGYNVNSYAEFWDRVAQTKGQTGSALANFFGFTKPEQQRLREMRKAAAAMPESCVGPRAAADAADYWKWQAKVVAYSGLGRRESLTGVLLRRPLEPPLQADIEHLRFSPDGKYVFAQDDSSIYVLSRQPFKVLFRVDAPEALRAKFSPDSRLLVFQTPGLRVERWNIESQTRESVAEVVVPKRCVNSDLSPDGKLLACVGSELELNLFDTGNNQVVYTKKKVAVADPNAARLASFFSQLGFDVSIRASVNMQFSPDGKYLAIGNSVSAFALEVESFTELKLPGKLRDLMNASFTFYGSDRFLGTGGAKGDKTTLAKWPSGEVLRTVDVGNASVEAPAHGDFVLIRPIDKYAVGVMNLQTQKIFLANRTSALDVYDDYYVSERRTGEVGLYSRDSNGALEVAVLPRGTLGVMHASAISADGRYLAISQRSRGGVWDLEKGERVFFVRGFRGAYVGADGTVFADFPKFQETERKLVRMDSVRRETLDGAAVDEAATQYGEYLVAIRPKKKDAGLQREVTLEVRDVRTNNVLWSRFFPKERPGLYVGSGMPAMVLWWNLTEGHAKEVIQDDPALKARLAAMGEKEGDYLLEVVETATGKTRGKLLVETGKGSFKLDRVFTTADWVLVEDTAGRILIYQLSTNEQKARIFGWRAAVAPSGNAFCVEGEDGKLSLFRFGETEPEREYTFASPIRMLRFTADGKRLLVLTSDQTVFLLDAMAGVN